MKFSILCTDVRVIVATAVICTATIGGLIFLPDDGDVYMPITPTLSHELPTYSGGNPGGMRTAGMGSVVTVRPSSSLLRPVRPVAMQAPAGYSHTRASVSASGSGSSYTVYSTAANYGDHSVVFGGSGGGSVSGGSSRVSAPDGGGFAVASALSLPKRTSRPLLAGARPSVDEDLTHGGPLGIYTGDGDDMGGVYEGDGPGVITGGENAVMDDPIIDNYGQPIGDTLWPLMLMALAYLGWRYRQQLKFIITK